MLKDEFLKTLERRLSGIPKKDLDKTLEYYNEIISDKQEEGISEAEAVNSLGTMDEIVDNILKEIPIQKLVKEKLKLNRKLKTWEIVLISATAIIWIPLLIVAMTLVLVLYVCLWSGVIALAAAAISCASTSLIILPGILDIFAGNIGSGLVIVGIGMASLGVAILLGILVCELAKIMIIVCKKLVLKIKSLFIRGEKDEI